VVLLKFGLNNNVHVDEWSEYRKNNLDNNFRSSLLTFIKTTKMWDSEPILMTQFSRINNSDAYVKNSMKKQLNLFHLRSM
jgi:hypothetical protein